MSIFLHELKVCNYPRKQQTFNFFTTGYCLFAFQIFPSHRTPIFIAQEYNAYYFVFSIKIPGKSNHKSEFYSRLYLENNLSKRQN